MPNTATCSFLELVSPRVSSERGSRPHSSRCWGVTASRGRTFLEEENQPGRTTAVILTDAFWRTKVGADPAVVGRTLRLDGAPALVVGVLPPGFHFDYPTLRIPEAVDIYVSYPFEYLGWGPSSSGHGQPVRVLARLRKGVTQAQAEAELRSIGQALAREHPTEITIPMADRAASPLNRSRCGTPSWGRNARFFGYCLEV